MIKPFKIEDLGYFLPNELSNPDRVLDQLIDPAFEVQTVWGTDGLVQAIICFRNYWGRNWAGFVLVASHFNPIGTRALRRHLHGLLLARGALRFQTDSVATNCQRKWHRFMGFELEGTRKKLVFGKDYDCWAILREV